MPDQNAKRPRWKIDERLDALMNTPVRVQATKFSPRLENGIRALPFHPVDSLLLPDGSSAAGLPVYFEGVLNAWERFIGVIYMDLFALPDANDRAEGIVYFREKTSVILRAPTRIKLAAPFRVEPIPEDLGVYWSDLQISLFQFHLGL